MTVTKADLRPRCRAAVLEALEQLGGEGARRDVLVLAERLAGFSNAELELPAPPAATSRFKRFVDHQLAAALTGLKRDGLVDNPDWGRWQLCAPPAARESAPVPGPPITERVRELRAMTLRDYRRTPEWERARAAAIEQAGACCQRDPAHAGRPVEVHPASSARRGTERPSELIVLCAECYAAHHASPERRGSIAPPSAAITRPTIAQRRSSLLRRTLQRLR